MPGNMNTVRRSCWYDLIVKGLDISGLQLQMIETADGPVRRYCRPEDVATAPVAATAPPRSAAMTLPAWLREVVPSVRANETVLRPSGPTEQGGVRIGTGDQAQTRARAVQRGTLVHRLLQSLPDIAPGRRRDAALGYLDRHAGDWSDGDREALGEAVLALIGDARFAAVFAPGSRAEVLIVGRLQRPGRPPALVSGQIDRLVVTPGEVLIVDFKTNQAPPATVAEAPAAYLRQLALYRAVLQKLYRERPIRAALLWTETPELMEISAPALDAALAFARTGLEQA
jgi:ATP-dependent helicase/nuclease subunit A